MSGAISDSSAQRFISTVENYGGSLLEVYVDSEGGSLDGAFKMAAALQRFQGRTEVFLGRAHSAAAYVGLPADKVIAARDATVLLHPLTIVSTAVHNATASDLKSIANHLESMKVTASRMLEARSGTPDSYWRLLMEEETYLAAEALLEHRLVDEISPLPRSYFPKEQVEKLKRPASRAFVGARR